VRVGKKKRKEKVLVVMLQESQSLTSEKVENFITGSAEGATTHLKRPEWVPDEASETCMGCSSEFNFFNRRHHCRGNNTPPSTIILYFIPISIGMFGD